MINFSISIAEADAFLSGIVGSDHWAATSDELKRGALDIAAATIAALGYSLPDTPDYATIAAVSLEALARTDPARVAAHRAADSGIAAASAGHASERYAAAPLGGLWDASARALLRPFAMANAPIRN